MVALTDHMPRDQQYMLDPERHARAEVERKFGCSATLQTALTGPQTGERTVMLFSLSDPARGDVYAWNEQREGMPWAPPKVIIVPVTADVNSEIAAIESQAKRPL